MTINFCELNIRGMALYHEKHEIRPHENIPLYGNDNSYDPDNTRKHMYLMWVIGLM